MENYASVAPNSPPHSFPEHDAPLGSSLTGPGHSYQQYWQSRRKYLDTTNQPHSSATIRQGEICSDQNFSELPSDSQQVALTTLQDCDIGTICAWLTGLRSGENLFQPSCLSAQQLEAISTLKDCTNSLVSAWLHHIRRGGSFSALYSHYGKSNFVVQGPASASTRNAWQEPSNTSRSSSSSFGPPTSLYDSCTSLSTQRSSWSRGTFLDVSQEPSIGENSAIPPVAAAHTHWCFVCEIPRVFTTCDGWKRHMKEHETRYPCLPHGREIHTAHGPECALCGVLNPDERHYSLHKTLPCSDKTLVTRSYTRKSHLINHLKSHGISDGFALAEKWRDTIDKKYFSCGFCIAFFHSHTDQLNHIDNVHYKNHQHISEWESNRVILGLLLQPGVQDSWRNLLTVYPQYNLSGFRWSPGAAKNLQLRLEKSDEAANNLALAAFKESTYSWIQNMQVESMPVVGFSHRNMNIHHNVANIQPNATLAQMPFAPKQGSVYDGGLGNIPPRAQHPALLSMAINHPRPGVLNADPTVHQNNSSQELTMADRPQNYRDVQFGLSSSSSNSWAPPQSASRAPCNRSTGSPSDVYGGQAAIPGTHAARPNLQASSPPKPLAGHTGHPNINSARRTHTPAANHPTLLGSNHPASSSTPASNFPRGNGPSSLPARPTKQPSRTKLKDHYDIDTEADMDFDLGDIQYYMREEGHTRSERRRR